MCAAGEGDCDSDSDCQTGYCANDVGHNYGATSLFDVCEVRTPCMPANLDWSCCTFSLPCADGDGDCDTDSDCWSGHCAHDVGANYGVDSLFDVCETPACSPSNLDWNCCTSSSPCADKQGDCDYDSECMSGNCVHNVGLQYGVTTSFDVCEASVCTPANMDWSCCTASRPCAAGNGDCDYDSDCLTGYCGHNVGSNYGATSSFDICEKMAACDPRNLNWSCCTSSAPCANGHGDCDYDSDCQSGFCSHNVGLGYGVSYSFDVCDAKPATVSPSLSPTPSPVTPAPTATVTPAPTANYPSCSLKKTDFATLKDMCDQCSTMSYCKSKYKKARGGRKEKCKCKKLKCKKCKKDQTCCAQNPLGPCTFDFAANKCT